MGVVHLYVWNHLPSAANRHGLVARTEQPMLSEFIEERRTRFLQLQIKDLNEARHAHCFPTHSRWKSGNRNPTSAKRHRLHQLVHGVPRIGPAKVEGTWNLPPERAGTQQSLQKIPACLRMQHRVADQRQSSFVYRQAPPSIPAGYKRHGRHGRRRASGAPPKQESDSKR